MVARWRHCSPSRRRDGGADPARPDAAGLGRGEPRRTWTTTERPRSSATASPGRPALAANPLELSAVMALALPFAAYLLLSVPLVARAAVVPRVRGADRPGRRALDLADRLAGGRRRCSSSRSPPTCAARRRRARPRCRDRAGRTVATLVPASVDATLPAVREGRQRGSQPGDAPAGLRGARQPARTAPVVRAGPQRRSATYVARDGNGLILDNQYLLADRRDRRDRAGCTARAVSCRRAPPPPRRTRGADDRARAVGRRRAGAVVGLRRHVRDVRRAAVHPGERVVHGGGRTRRRHPSSAGSSRTLATRCRRGSGLRCRAPPTTSS